MALQPILTGRKPRLNFTDPYAIRESGTRQNQLIDIAGANAANLGGAVSPLEAAGTDLNRLSRVPAIRRAAIGGTMDSMFKAYQMARGQEQDAENKREFDLTLPTRWAGIGERAAANQNLTDWRLRELEQKGQIAGQTDQTRRDITGANIQSRGTIAANAQQGMNERQQRAQTFKKKMTGQKFGDVYAFRRIYEQTTPRKTRRELENTGLYDIPGKSKPTADPVKVNEALKQADADYEKGLQEAYQDYVALPDAPAAPPGSLPGAVRPPAIPPAQTPDGAVLMRPASTAVPPVNPLAGIWDATNRAAVQIPAVLNRIADNNAQRNMIPDPSIDRNPSALPAWMDRFDWTNPMNQEPAPDMYTIQANRPTDGRKDAMGAPVAPEVTPETIGRRPVLTPPLLPRAAATPPPQVTPNTAETRQEAFIKLRAKHPNATDAQINAVLDKMEQSA